MVGNAFHPGAAPAVHDLLRLTSGTVEQLIRDADQDGVAWVADSLRAVPWAVVRRARPTKRGRVPVGVRGPLRIHRWAGEIRTDGGDKLLSPSDLTGITSLRDELPAFSALATLGVLCRSNGQFSAGCDWGPGGSVGFELATGDTTVTQWSDLDVVIRMNSFPSGDTLETLHRMHQIAADDTGAKIDALIETPGGGYALSELVESIRSGRGEPVVRRCPTGPELVQPCLVIT